MAEETKATKTAKSFDLELRRTNALEDIAKSLSNISAWLDEIDKEDWSSRIQWYLDLIKKSWIDPKLEERE